MSDAVTTDPAVDSVEPTGDPVETEPTTDLGDAGKKALAAERAAKRAAEKRAAELEARVQEFEDSNKSEQEKAAARAEAAEKRAAEAEAKALRLEVADELKVPANLRKFLTASTADDLREQATALMDELTAATAGQRTTPRPDPTQGAKPDGVAGQLTRADLAGMSPDEINAAREAGRLNDVLGIK